MRLHLTQLELAGRASSDEGAGLDAATVSERTITSIEKLVPAGESWNRPRPSTVRALAAAFGLDPGTPEFNAFLAAASETLQHDRRQITPSRAHNPVVSRSSPAQGSVGFVPQGRERHIAHLRSAISDAVAGKPGVVMVGAAPGSGKSALISEACRSATATYPSLAVLYGECSAHLSTPDAWQPFRQAIALMIGDIDSANAIQRVSPANLRVLDDRRVSALRTLAFDAPDLLERMIPVSLVQSVVEHDDVDEAVASRLQDVMASPRSASANVNSQLEHMLIAYASHGPVILVLEDLHWADQASTAFLFQLVRRIRETTLPVLIIGSYRPSDLPSGHDGAGAMHSVSNVLHELPRFFPNALLDLSSAVGGDEGRSFVDAIVSQQLDRVSPGLRESLFEQTQGLPLFVISMLRWYEATGALTYDAEGVATLDRSRLPSRLPAEIDSVFAILIGRLSPQVQHLLDVASVQGDTFSAEILMDVCELSKDELIRLLDGELCFQHQILAPGGTQTIAGIRSHSYHFTHILLRDYVYHRLTTLQRHHLHATIAEAKCNRYGRHAHEASRLIARHFEAAEDYDNAALHWVKAGDYAMATVNYEVSDAAYRHVETLPVTQASIWAQAQALVGRGNSARGLGNRDQAMHELREAYAMAEHHGVRSVMANSLTSLAMLDYDAGRMSDGSDRLRRAIELLLEIGDEIEAGRSLALLSHTLAGLGELDEAFAAARRAVDILRASNDEAVLLTAQIAYANCLFEVGRFQQAIDLYETYAAIARRLENPHREAVSLMNKFQAHLELGQLPEARATSSMLNAMNHRINHRLRGSVLFERGLLAEMDGDWDGAEAFYQESASCREIHRQHGQWIDSLAGMLRVATARNDQDAMTRLTDQIRTMIANRGIEGVEYVGRAYLTLARADHALGNTDSAALTVRAGVAFIEHRASRLAGPADRASYLDNIPSHRALRSLGDIWQTGCAAAP